jgi:peptidoglycan/LPS O-acetylase OafA/YrhL
MMSRLSILVAANQRISQFTSPDDASRPRFVTLQAKMQSAGGFTTGFDYLRIGLSVAVLAFHTTWVSSGSNEFEASLWTGPYRFLFAAIVPAFFALSGFLVAGSLARTRIHQFITLRFIRLMPALAVEILISAIIVGLIFTDLPSSQYLMSRQFYAYLLNIVGRIHYYLPGVFEHNPGPGIVNGQLWTIPFEMECYLALVLLSISTLLRRRFAFVAITVVLCFGMTIWVFGGHPVDAITHSPGRMLVLCFLAAVSLHLYRDVIPYSGALAAVSGAAAAVLLQIPDACYLAAFPVAYFTVWLGLMRPPAIPFGDLSYGLFLFHYPVEQTVVHVFPAVRSWWLLTLIALPATTICAWLSWNLVEKPTLTRKKSIVAAVDRAWAAMSNVGRSIAAHRVGADRSCASGHVSRLGEATLPIMSEAASLRSSAGGPPLPTGVGSTSA